MKPLRFTWDPNKAASNLHKHGVSFTEAQTVFYDDEHAEWEDLGLSTTLRLLIVCHCYRESDGVIRIISARKANNQEASYYDR